ncbi:hypothetical protein [Microcoleus sp. F4-D5]|uniref:hypothetical protein n=1 Tax=Microcoleus sp. F4-D5 TaxID=2818760 RepID=UPI002FD23D4F
MSDNQQKQEATGSRNQIILAVISVVGVLGGAMFANWDKIHPSSSKTPLTNSDKVIPSSSTDVPAGNYLLTCPNRSVKDDILTASCYNVENKLQESSLANPKRCIFGIENSKGTLVCREDR